jgi:hypothetical protein
VRTYSRLQAPTPGCRHLLQLSDLPTTTVVLAYTSHISHRPTATIWLWKDARSSIAACGPPLTYALKTVEPVDGRSTTKVEKPWMYTSTTAPPLVDLMFVMKSREMPKALSVACVQGGRAGLLAALRGCALHCGGAVERRSSALLWGCRRCGKVWARGERGAAHSSGVDTPASTRRRDEGASLGTSQTPYGRYCPRSRRVCAGRKSTRQRPAERRRGVGPVWGGIYDIGCVRTHGQPTIEYTSVRM